MVNMFKKTSLSTEKIIERTKEYFGEKGLNLVLTEENPDCLNYEGGGGYVNINICKDGNENRIDVVSVEWEKQVKDFLTKL